MQALSIEPTMDERDLENMRRDIEGLVLRVRDVENLSSPYSQQLLTEFREMQRKLADYAEHGTPTSRRELKHMEERVADMKTELAKKADANELEDLKEETRSNRTMVRSALIAAALALGSGIMLFIIQRAVK